MLPVLNEIRQSRNMLSTFRGYNHSSVIADGEFYDMQNLSSDEFPALSPIKPRKIHQTTMTGLPLALARHNVGTDGTNELFGVVGNGLYNMMTNARLLTLNTIPDVATIIPFGTYLIVKADFDLYYYNLLDSNDHGKVTFSENMSALYCAPCDADGTLLTIAYRSAADPSEISTIENGKLWYDTANKQLKKYTSTTNTWIVMPMYIYVSKSTGIPSSIKEGMSLKLSDINTQGAPEDQIPELEALEGKMYTIVKATSTSFIIQGILSGTVDSLAGLTISNNIPVMDFVIENKNRLWGCRYGANAEGNFVNEIYASKLGDFKTWFAFSGISTDSYTASCGTPGQWTAAVDFQSSPIFFKEDCLHKVYGDYPANYQIKVVACKGVQSGSWRSLAFVDNVLYYKSVNGICYYDGSLPYEITDVFGGIDYKNSCAGASRGKYIISMQEASQSQSVLPYPVFVYDTKKKLWHREKGYGILYTCNTTSGDMVYISSQHSPVRLEWYNEQPTSYGTPISWYAETGILGLSSPDYKYVDKIAVRMMLPEGSSCSFYLQYDSEGSWIQVGSFTGNSTRTFNAIIRPKRCDHFKMKISGAGDFRIYSITTTTTSGSDCR